MFVAHTLQVSVWKNRRLLHRFLVQNARVFWTFPSAWARGSGAAVGVPGQPQGEDEANESNGLRAQHVPGAGGSYGDDVAKRQGPPDRKGGKRRSARWWLLARTMSVSWMNKFPGTTDACVLNAIDTAIAKSSSSACTATSQNQTAGRFAIYSRFLKANRPLLS